MSKHAFQIYSFRQSLLFQLFLKMGLLIPLMLLVFNCPAQINIGDNEPCEPVPCNQAQILISQKYPIGCGLTATCSDVDLSRQMVYSVDLEVTNFTLSTYEIDYQMFKVAVKLAFSGISPSQFSRINVQATESCNSAVLGQWSNELFEIDPDLGTVTLDLEDQVANSCPEDVLLVEATSEPGVGKVHLFDVVVDAYPDEIIRVEPIDLQISPQGIGTTCVLASDLLGNPLPNEVVFTIPAFYTVPLPPNPNNGFPNHVAVRLVQPTGVAPNSADFKVMLVNITSQPVTINYLDFITSFQLSEVLPDPVVTLSQNGLSSVVLGSGLLRHVKFTSTTNNMGLVIPPGGDVELATIRVTGPSLFGKCWYAEAKLPQDYKARIGIAPGICELLGMSQQQWEYKPNCTPSCMSGSAANINFVVKTVVDPTDNCRILLRVGFTPKDPSGPTSISLANINFILNFTGLNNFTADNAGIQLNQFECVTSSNTCVLPVFTGASLNWNQTYANAHVVNFSAGAFVEIPLVGDGCIGDISLGFLNINEVGSPGNCIPSVLPFELDANCTRLIAGELRTPPNLGVVDAFVCVYPTGQSVDCSMINTTIVCGEQFTTNAEGEFGNCTPYCSSVEKFTVRPFLDLDWLNGVNTWDLILISRNILGWEPFDSPYKLISADASNDGFVTTGDIVGLRKLILGTFSTISQISLGLNPGLNSWRFVNAEQVFSNPAYPFGDVIQEEIILAKNELPRYDLKFIGCKIGDVDYTATPNERQSRPTTGLSWSVPTASKKESILTIPVRYNGVESMEGLQFGLHFDPSKWNLIGPSAGDVAGVSSANFGLSAAHEGKIAFSWNVFPGESWPVQMGEVLFYLSFQAKENNAEASGFVLDLDNNIIADGAWTSNGTEYALAHVPVSEERLATMSTPVPTIAAVPNPTTESSVLFFSNNKAGKTRIVLSDAFGRQLSMQDRVITQGMQEIELTELIGQPAGVYSWWIKLPDGSMHSGRIVKQ